MKTKSVTRPKGLDYAAAGVNIPAGDEVAAFAKKLAGDLPPWLRKPWAKGLNPLVDLNLYLNAAGLPSIASTVDGVGTKLVLALHTGMLDGVGIDLVAMNVNDLLRYGAKPTRFMDVYSTGKLDPAQAKRVLASIHEGCRQAGCYLTGGETAELPGLLEPGKIDLVGTAEGLVAAGSKLDGMRPQAGDRVVAVRSSGLHSNGYSLVRKIVETAQLRRGAIYPELDRERTLAEVLMTPTRIYVRDGLLDLLNGGFISGLAHITGGGLAGKPANILPESLAIALRQYPMPRLFRFLQKRGNVSLEAMRSTFNCGYGLLMTVPEEHVVWVMETLEKAFGRRNVVPNAGTVVRRGPKAKAVIFGTRH